MCLTVDGVRWTRRQIAGVLGIAAALALAPYAWVRLAAVGHIYTVSQAPSAPVAIVFGAGIYPDGTPMLFLTARLDVARELYAAGKVRAILVDRQRQLGIDGGIVMEGRDIGTVVFPDLSRGARHSR